jgi:quercetin dioxygenase-like cupin family protein
MKCETRIGRTGSGFLSYRTARFPAGRMNAGLQYGISIHHRIILMTSGATMGDQRALGFIGDHSITGSEMEITRNGSRPSGKGPDEYFTGAVRVDPHMKAPDPARVAGVCVTFEPGARTAWHTHPLGQTLIIVAGTGWAQREGGAREEIRPGDVIWFAPGEKHWHGATATNAMTHIAIQEQLDGRTVDWLEKVSDDQYGS